MFKKIPVILCSQHWCQNVLSFHVQKVDIKISSHVMFTKLMSKFPVILCSQHWCQNVLSFHVQKIDVKISIHVMFTKLMSKVPVILCSNLAHTDFYIYIYSEIGLDLK